MGSCSGLAYYRFQASKGWTLQLIFAVIKKTCAFAVGAYIWIG